MDNMAGREMGPLLNELRDIRSALRRCLNATDRLNAKFNGPHPTQAEAPNKLPSADSVRSLVADIVSLSSLLEKSIESHHEFVGDNSDNAAPRAVGY
jgi:hypothetical protein